MILENAGRVKFQSLIGFKINWNYNITSTYLGIKMVSIPNRV
ncbi:conserved hypothetical protein [Microcystis aeruginosa PCC 9717]|uniref:Uncharacterized protein n=1 Tax=Microcystis aeruginosa PCC 9717 TaxID=1160286 RepID=I4FXK4_MICAE|nr:conserved hypothetical protein [Microcystis aeruginosa PCC 9717]